VLLETNKQTHVERDSNPFHCVETRRMLTSLDLKITEG
jgi:hypothetical protein